MSTNAVPSFSCSCPLGYSASLCEIPVPNACDTGPCQHGGTCLLRTLDNYTCACSSGFRGAKCEAVDHCALHPCKNGAQCTSLSDSHRCTCAPGFAGPTCAVDIDECKRNPCIHGRCVNTHGSYKWVQSYWLLSSTICWSFLASLSRRHDCQMITKLTRQSCWRRPKKVRGEIFSSHLYYYLLFNIFFFNVVSFQKY